MYVPFNIYEKGTFLYENFDEPLLYMPATECNRLRIITAFTDCERISTHMISLAEGIRKKKYCSDLSIEIILGMTKSSLSQKKHEDICRLIRFLKYTKYMPKISCQYICEGKEVHSKIYLWCKDKEDGGLEMPKIAYCGSLNYTMNAFYKRRESVAICDSVQAWRYYQELKKDVLDCMDPSVIEKIKKLTNGPGELSKEDDGEEAEYSYYDKLTPIDTIKISLLKADGSDTGYGSGINWGIRSNGTKRNPNQAYIPYNANDKKEGFFPDRIRPEDESCPMFKVITKDFGSFHMRMAQQGNKALHSVESNAILGEWIRKKIHAPSGGYITKQMLELYGKTYVTFRKYSNGVYLLDF